VTPGYLPAIANHLWQCSLFVGIVWLLSLTLRNNRARVRHWVWLAASWKFLIPCSVLMLWGGQIHWRTAPQTPQSSLSAVMEEVSQPFTATASPIPMPARLPAASRIPALLWTTWACGFFGIGCSWWIRWRRIRAAVRAGSPVHLDIPIRAVSSPTLLEPGVFGVFRPVLLLPEGILDRLTAAQLRGVIAHELCHVYHRDNLIAAIQMFVETIFWFHPLAWWIGKRMVDERERACDEEVLSLGNDPRVYAEGILNVCKLYTESPLACTCGITGSDLKKRIAAIAEGRVGSKLSPIKKVALAMVTSSTLAIPLTIGIIKAPALSAQNSSSPSTKEPAPAFEAASVKPCKEDVDNGGRGGGGGGSGRSASGRLDLPCQPVRGLIRIAYIRANFRTTGEDNLQMEGGPAWIDAKRYSIAAKADGPVPIEVMEGPMLQRLLEDRFHLKTHREMREASVYALSVAKGGLKIKPAAPGSCTVRDADDTDFVAPAAAQKPYCGEAGMAMSPYRFKFTLASGTLRQLASNLGARVDRPVLDKTGIEDKFDFHLEFAPISADPSDERTAPSIFSALAEMGLRLEAVKGPRNYLIIDHVEEPTEN
jgi:bla regulator protein blaR1